jgi:hypothetical protein
MAFTRLSSGNSLEMCEEVYGVAKKYYINCNKRICEQLEGT